MAVGAKTLACSRIISTYSRTMSARLSTQVDKPKGSAGTFLAVVFITLSFACNAAVSNTSLGSYEENGSYTNAISENSAISDNEAQHLEHDEIVVSGKDVTTYGKAVPILSLPLQIAVAANFAKPLRNIANDYFKKTGQQVSVTVSSSGTLFAQLTHGAQFDVFLSADTARPNALVEAGRVNAEDVHVYAKGRLAFLSSNTTVSTPNFTAASLAGKKLAIANPKLAPYGNAAKQYLINSNQWSAVSPHMVMGKNVLQTYQFFTTGNADYALVAYSLTLSDKLNNNVVFLIPDALHQPILQSLAVTADDDRKAAASAFAQYLLSSEVQESLLTWGYQSADVSKLVGLEENVNVTKSDTTLDTKQQVNRQFTQENNEAAKEHKRADNSDAWGVQ